MEEVDEVELVVQRVAALDLGKATLEACMRVPHPSKPGRRMQEIRDYATTTAALLEMDLPQNRGRMHYEPPDPLVTPRRRENTVGLPADADYPLVCEPVYKPGDFQ